MKKFTIFLLISLMFVLAACGNQGDGSKGKDSSSKGDKETVTIHNQFEARGDKKDGSDAKKVDDKVSVPKNPKRAVVLDYGALDTIKELGLADKVKGLPKGEGGKSLPDFLKEFKDDKYINTGNLKEINFDKVAEAKPDVIYISGRAASQQNLDEFKKAASDAKIVYVGADDNNELQSLKDNTSNLGKIYDKEDKAKKLNKKLDDKVADVKKHTKDMKDDKSMFLLVNEGELSTFGPKARFGSLIFDTLGFTPADKDVKASTHGQNVSNEYINEKNPSIIFAMDRGQAIGGEATAKKALNNDVLKDVKANKEDQVYELDPKLWYFSSGSTSTTALKQIEDLEKALK